MAKFILLLFPLIALAMVRLGSTAPASISPEAYWKLKLPNTPMLNSIKNSLPSPGDQAMDMPLKGVQPSAKESLPSIKGPYDDGLLSYSKKGLASTNSYGGLLAYSKKGLSSTNSYGGLLAYSKKGLASTNSYGGLLAYSKKGLASTNSYGSLLAYSKKGLASTNSYGGLLAYSKKGLSSTRGYNGLLSYSKKGLESTKGYNGLLSYGKKGLESTSGYNGLLSYKKQQAHDHAKESVRVDDATKNRVFFVEKKLNLGTKMTLHFQKSIQTGVFLPREVSNKIPFSSDKIQETLKILSLDPKSEEAKVLSHRIELCEEPTIEGVEKKCVTSLESMVDYVISKIGTNVKALTTQVEKDSTMEYTIKGVKKLVKDDRETVVCHKMGYPYALFFCHRTKTIRSYMVSLIGKDGSIIEAVAACHKETNDFLDNYAKNVLNVVPGSTHICHFPPAEDTIIWVPNK
ncbi:BURP domain protein RD22 isoform X2 [Spinacia oleracea]|uniref:BURP domain protein RD22 isoform X2 n=1 Tax=Spinacia oleracea TaxID=3562 RepID=A0A9R0JHE6_SPIOL|nr:BURP domain protein RD22-like isoform X2 [Spinacia oleracea]